MDDLVQFLRARLDEDERIAQAATDGPWWYNPGKQWLGPEAFEKYDLRQGEEFVGYGGPHPFTGAVCATGPANNMQSMKDAEHIARQDPARVLREVEAKRRAMGRHHDFQGWCAGCGNDLTYPITECPELRDLAAAYADHPDFRNEWRP